MKKIIIWGHKNNGHTHGYIHQSYFKAFKSLGFETYWFDNNDDVSNFNFEDCLFLTEGQVESNIPLVKSSKYVLHHTNLDKYINKNIKFINLGNYSKWCLDGVSPYHKENKVEKINDFCYWDSTSNIVYQPWATDLLPNEIDINLAVGFDDKKTEIYYVGGWYGHDNPDYLNLFHRTSSEDGKNFHIVKTNSDRENFNLVRNSFLSIDIRGDWHIEYGYLPCRIFKNISYGRLTGTNSPHVKQIFGDFVVYDSNIKDLYLKLKETEKNTNINLIKDAMNYVKTIHTFHNRIENLLKLI